MADYYSSNYYTHKIDKIANRSETLPDAAATITGNMCTWVIGTQTATHNFDIKRYENTKFSEYLPEVGKPTIIIKCIASAAVFNVVIRCDDGAGGYTTLCTFAADYSVTPSYFVARISDTLGADGRYLWEAA